MLYSNSRIVANLFGNGKMLQCHSCNDMEYLDSMSYQEASVFWAPHISGHSPLGVLKRISGLWVPAVGAYFGAQCQAIGMLVRIAGDIIMISPPLISTAAELQQVRSLIAFA